MLPLVSLCLSLLHLRHFLPPLTRHRESTNGLLLPAAITRQTLTTQAPPPPQLRSQPASHQSKASNQNRTERNRTEQNGTEQIQLTDQVDFGLGVLPAHVLGEVVEAALCHCFLVHVLARKRGHVVCEDPADLLTPHTHHTFIVIDKTSAHTVCASWVTVPSLQHPSLML